MPANKANIEKGISSKIKSSLWEINKDRCTSVSSYDLKFKYEHDANNLKFQEFQRLILQQGHILSDSSDEVKNSKGPEYMHSKKATYRLINDLNLNNKQLEQILERIKRR